MLGIQFLLPKKEKIGDSESDEKEVTFNFENVFQFKASK